jgi:hypothetical protein
MLSAQFFTIIVAVEVYIANTRYNWDRHAWDFHLQYFTRKSAHANLSMAVSDN